MMSKRHRDPDPSPPEPPPPPENRELASLIRMLRSRRRYAVLTWHLESSYHDTEEAARHALAAVPGLMRAGVVHRETGEVWSSAPALPVIEAAVTDELGGGLHRQGTIGDFSRPLKRRSRGYDD